MDDDAGAQRLTTEMPTVPRAEKRTIKPNIMELRTYFARPKVGPSFDIVCSKLQINLHEAELDNFIWFICRNTGASLEVRTVPFGQKAGICDDLCSQVENMPPINFSINDNTTVQLILELSQTPCLGQQYCIVTFDLAVAKKAY